MEARLFQLIMSVSAKCWATEQKIMDQLGLSPAEFNALLILEEDEHLPAFELSAKMGLSPSRGSRVIARLAKQGYVTVETAAEDRRRLQVHLTESGILMQRRIAELMTECEERLLKALTQPEQELVRTALKLLVRAM